MATFDENIKNLMGIEPLAAAEQITGQSYKDSEATSFIGLAIQIEKSKSLRAALEVSGDTYHGMLLEDYLSIAKSEGFDIVAEIPFCIKEDYSGNMKPEDKWEHERMFFLWHADGLLMIMDTYDGNRPNRVDCHFNLLVDKESSRSAVHEYIGTRNYVDGGAAFGQDAEIIVGDLSDPLQALRLKLREVRKYGRFLNPWVGGPFLWLLHHGDTRGNKKYDMDKINTERIAMMPEHIQKAISAPRW